MERRRVRLGDVIDDYCQRCRLIMNHGVVSMVGDEVRKVRCNTCMSEHVYKHGKVPARKRRETGKLFAEVLRGMGREPDAPAEEREPEPEREVGEERDAQAAPDAEPDEDRPAPEAGAEAAEAGAAAIPAGEDEAARPTGHEQDHGVRRKLYTIRRFSGGKAPTGGGTPPKR